MISIVISSYQPAKLEVLKKSISETIHVPFEVIVIRNYNEVSLAKAYNDGAAQAKFNFLCFVHEDVVFHTQGWGRIALNIFRDTTIGLIGVAGGTYKSKGISSAWDNGEMFVNLLQHKEDQCFHYREPVAYQLPLADVLILDGVFLCLSKDVWAKCKFDEKVLTGFHFYDLDLSLSVQQLNLRVCVTYNILLEHFSFGKTDYEWYKEAKKIHRKWDKRLPWSLRDYSENKKLEFNYNAAIALAIRVFQDPNFHLISKFKAILQFTLIKPFNINTYRDIKTLIFDHLL